MPSLPEAVETKYGKPFFDIPVIEVACVSLSLRGCGRFRPPSVLILAGCDIEQAGDENDLRQQCDGVTELDLSKNKFKQWEEVFKILQFVPGLTFLNLSYNAFENSCFNSVCGHFNQLGKLVLNGTGLKWKDVYALLALAPSLEELHLCLNAYNNVDKCCFPLQTVKRLHFNCNPITEWVEIEHLGIAFPSLEILILADCPIETLSPDCCYEKLFPRLKYLSLNNSKLNSWEDIDRINNFPMLLELRLHQCTLFEQYPDDQRRNLTIGRLEFIQRLNGGANISEEEKENAERFFIRHYMDLKTEQLPKRYFDLVSRHGQLNPLVNVSLKPEKSVQVSIKYGDICLEKTFSVYIKVIDVKKAIAPELGIPCSHMRIFYVDKANGAAYSPEELKINNKQLYTLNVRSGDEFYIDVKMIVKEETFNCADIKTNSQNNCHNNNISKESGAATKKSDSESNKTLKIPQKPVVVQRRSFSERRLSPNLKTPKRERKDSEKSPEIKEHSEIKYSFQPKSKKQSKFNKDSNATSSSSSSSVITTEPTSVEKAAIIEDEKPEVIEKLKEDNVMVVPSDQSQDIVLKSDKITLTVEKMEPDVTKIEEAEDES